MEAPCALVVCFFRDENDKLVMLCLYQKNGTRDSIQEPLAKFCVQYKLTLTEVKFYPVDAVPKELPAPMLCWDGFKAPMPLPMWLGGFKRPNGAPYSVTIRFSDSDLRNIKDTNLRLCIAKQVAPVDDPGAEGQASVVWLAIEDIYPINKIEWTEQYGLFATRTSLIDGATITQTSNKNNVNPGEYEFDEYNQFKKVKEHPESHLYSVTNKKSKMESLGLLQAVQTNSIGSIMNPVAVFQVMPGITLQMTPIVKISVWLSTTYNSGSVIAKAISNVTIVDMTSGTKALKYNNGLFEEDSGIVFKQTLLPPEFANKK